MSLAATSHTAPAGESRPLRETVRDPMFLFFAGLALATRLTFWLYTGRVWEDAIISLSPARNVWEGFGLTHHASEPRVHSFTSGLGELILIAGEGFGTGNGLLAMRLASLAAAVAAIYYCYRLCRQLRLHWSAQVVALGFIATDHLHVFFGMSGMETQVATALVLANACYFMERRWTRLGIATGLAVICRPEFLLWPAILAIALAIEWRNGRRAAFPAVVLPALLVAAPWFLFTTIYYGSPVPHTIVAKSFIAKVAVQNLSVRAYLADAWRHIAPFREFPAFTEAPLPDPVLQAIVALAVALALAGAVHAIRLQPRMLAVFTFLTGFVVYRVAARVNPYFMWYLPPFTALMFLFAACGVSWLVSRWKTLGVAAAFVLVAGYALHLPFSMPLDRRTQEGIEDDVRTRVGKILNGVMSESDAVILEPLGFIGWEAKNKTIYDVPGLGSPKAFAAFRKSLTIAGMVHDLSPRFLVLRPHEWAEFSTKAPDLAARYEAVSTTQARPDLSLRVPGAAYDNGDRSFTIYRARE